MNVTISAEREGRLGTLKLVIQAGAERGDPTEISILYDKAPLDTITQWDSWQEAEDAGEQFLAHVQELKNIETIYRTQMLGGNTDGDDAEM